ncbi:Protein fmp52, mitochondrial [Oleoguttula sp. CCFEE 5521]
MYLWVQAGARSKVTGSFLPQAGPHDRGAEMTTAVLAGSTGQTGTPILTHLLAAPSISSVQAFTRKTLPHTSSTLTPLTASDPHAWPSLYPSNAQIFFSALATSRAIAEGFENQRKIDYDLNLALATKAKESGTKVYVLISAANANPHSYFGYPKMKGELEEAIKALNFEHTIFVRPGWIAGERQTTTENVLKRVKGLLGTVGGDRAVDFWAQTPEVIGRAAVKAGLEALEGKQGEKVRVLGGGEIIRLGKKEWKA